MWILDFLDDIASDLSAFHRIDDLTCLESYALFRLAPRLPAYQGVMAARAAALHQEETGQGASAMPGRRLSPGQSRGEPIQGTAANLRGVSDLQGLFDVVEVKRA